MIILLHGYKNVASSTTKSIESIVIDDKRRLWNYEASELAKSSRRSVKKYMKLFGIKTKKGKRGKLVIVKTLQQRMHEFIMYMSKGDSATKAAKKSQYSN